MTVRRLGQGGPTTILHGVVELVHADLLPLAVLVLFASIIVPIFKLRRCARILVMTHRRSPTWLREAERASFDSSGSSGDGR